MTVFEIRKYQNATLRIHKQLFSEQSPNRKKAIRRSVNARQAVVTKWLRADGLIQ